MNKVKGILKIKEYGVARYSFYNIYDFPCRIGRSLENDIILPHATISHNHAIIDYVEEKYIIRNLSSTNGLSCNGKQVEETSFEKKNRIAIGTLQADLLREESLEKTTLKKISYFTFRTQSTPRLLLIISLYLVAIYLLSLFNNWLNQPLEAKDAVNLLWSMMMVVGSIVWLTSIIGILGKIQVKRHIFKPIFLFLLSIWAILSFIKIPAPYIIFALNSRVGDNILTIFVGTLITLYTLYGLGRRLFPYSTTKRVIITVLSIYIGLSSLGTISYYAVDEEIDYDFSAAYSYPLLSYDKEDNGIQNLWDKMDKSFKKVAEKRVKALKKKEELK